MFVLKKQEIEVLCTRLNSKYKIYQILFKWNDISNTIEQHFMIREQK